MWFIGVEVEQETSAPPPKKNPGSAPASYRLVSYRTSAHLSQNRPWSGCLAHTLYPECNNCRVVYTGVLAIDNGPYCKLFEGVTLKIVSRY